MHKKLFNVCLPRLIGIYAVFLFVSKFDLSDRWTETPLPKPPISDTH